MTRQTKAQLQQEIEQLRQRVRVSEARAGAEALALLPEMAASLAAALDSEEILALVYQYTPRLIETENFHLALYMEAPQELFFALAVVDGERAPEDEARYPLGEGLTEYVLRTREPLLIREDIPGTRERLGIQVVGRQGALSWLGVPLEAGQRVIGVLAVQSYAAPRKYTEQHRDLLVLMAGYIAAALERVRLSDQRARQLEELRVLNELGQAFSETLPLPQIFQVTHRLVGEILDAENFYIGQYDAQRDMWENTYHLEHGERLTGQWRKLGFGLTNHVIRRRETLLLRSPQAVAEFMDAQGVALVGEPAQAWLGVPLLTGEAVIGVMVIQSYTEAYAYDASAQVFFQAVAAQVASAIQKCRMSERARVALDQTHTLHQVGRSVTTAQDLETVFREMVNNVAETLPADRVTLITFDVQQQAVEHFMAGGPGADDVVRGTFEELWEGLSGWVLRERQPALSPKGVPDARESPAVQQRRADTHCGAIIAVPLLYRDEAVGTVTAINRPEQRDFTEQDVALLQTIAGQIAIALESRQLEEEREQKVAEMALLNQIGQQLATVMTMEEVLEMTYEQVGRRFDTRSFFIALYQEGSSEWLLAFDVASGKRQPARRYTMGQGLTSHIIRTRHPVLFRSAQEHNAFLAARGFEQVGETPNSWMGVPLIASNEVVGVMGIESYAREDLYSEHDLAFFHAIAAQVANAVQNARLLSQFRVQAANERRARTITAQIRQAPDTTAILRSAAETLREALGASAVVLRLGSREQLLGASHNGADGE